MYCPQMNAGWVFEIACPCLVLCLVFEPECVLQQHLMESGESLLESHFEALELSGMMTKVELDPVVESPSATDAVAGNDPQAAIERACSAKNMLKTLVVAKKFYGEGLYDTEGVVFPAEVKFDILARLGRSPRTPAGYLELFREV